MTNVFEALMMIDYIFIVHVFVKLNCQQQQQQQQLNANVVQLLNEGSAENFLVLGSISPIYWSKLQMYLS
jgi:hypothetical protein